MEIRRKAKKSNGNHGNPKEIHRNLQNKHGSPMEINRKLNLERLSHTSVAATEALDSAPTII